jgi:hypothetical protein
MTIRKFKASRALWLFFLGIAACTGNEKSGVGYVPYNHTDKAIVSILINGQGGVASSTAHGSGGEVCCVVIPVQWKAGLKVSIKWQEDDTPVFDESGNRVVINGVPATVESPWKEQVVEVPSYDREMGLFFIHFLPGDEVKVAVSPYDPRHPKHPYRFTDIPLINP